MCKFCDKYHSVKGGIAGAEIKIDKCSNETNLTDCQVVISKNDNPALIIFSHGIAMGYFDIKFCPMCGRELRSEENE